MSEKSASRGLIIGRSTGDHRPFPVKLNSLKIPMGWPTRRILFLKAPSGNTGFTCLQ
jgi:hypothetical protein